MSFAAYPITIFYHCTTQLSFTYIYITFIKNLKKYLFMLNRLNSMFLALSTASFYNVEKLERFVPDRRVFFHQPYKNIEINLRNS